MRTGRASREDIPFGNNLIYSGAQVTFSQNKKIMLY